MLEDVLVDIGNTGRRAAAWVLDDGLVIAATDADAAGHAVAVVFEALKKTGGAIEEKHKAMALAIVSQFSPSPDAAFTARQCSSGMVDVSAQEAAIGYGYVRPARSGHECGGCLFDRPTRTITSFDPHRVWLASSEVH